MIDGDVIRPICKIRGGRAGRSQCVEFNRACRAIGTMLLLYPTYFNVRCTLCPSREDKGTCLFPALNVSGHTPSTSSSAPNSPTLGGRRNLSSSSVSSASSSSTHNAVGFQPLGGGGGGGKNSSEASSSTSEVLKSQFGTGRVLRYERFDPPDLLGGEDEAADDPFSDLRAPPPTTAPGGGGLSPEVLGEGPKPLDLDLMKDFQDLMLFGGGGSNGTAAKRDSEPTASPAPPINRNVSSKRQLPITTVYCAIVGANVMSYRTYFVP